MILPGRYLNTLEPTVQGTSFYYNAYIIEQVEPQAKFPIFLKTCDRLDKFQQEGRRDKEHEQTEQVIWLSTVGIVSPSAREQRL